MRGLVVVEVHGDECRHFESRTGFDHFVLSTPADSPAVIVVRDIEGRPLAVAL